MKALIDGDIILYSVGFASEERYYECSDGHVEQYAKDAKAHCAAVDALRTDVHDHRDLTTYELCVEPVEDMVWKGNVNSMIKGILEAVNADDYVLYLTGKDNFRDELTDTYKANRKDVAKPLHFKDIKEYLIKTRQVEIIDGMEADDAMGINQRPMKLTDEQQTCICSLDKDMRMIAGRHYNWRKGIRDTVTQADGDRWFWTQLLTGDATDNIIGLKGIGPKKAEKLLSECKTNQDMYEVCTHEYERVDRVDDLELNGHLLWIKRDPTSTWKDLIDA